MFARMWLRPRRHGHEQVSQQEGGDGPVIVVINGSDAVTSSNDGSSGAAANDDNEPSDAEQQRSQDEISPSNSNVSDDANNSNASSPTQDIVQHPHPITHPFLTSQIQTERHIRYRRQSTCTLLMLFFLVRLWIEAIIEKDVGLLFLSAMGTTWTYRWWNLRREEEEEFDRQIVENENGNNTSNVNAVGNGSGRDLAMNFDPDLGLMSFQAQMALAILESQQQMFENGGYGGNDRSDVHAGPGVSGEAKQKWKKFEWGDGDDLEVKKLTSGETAALSSEGTAGTTLSRPCSSTTIQRVGSNGSNYGSVSTAPTELEEDDEINVGMEVSNCNTTTKACPSSPSKLEDGLLLSDDEEPSCSICLCEYEKGDAVTRLPCHHIYHESCLDSWTTNHVRCPLCNYDLMDGFDPPTIQAGQQQPRNGASVVGRLIRARRSSTSRRRLANVLAAMEDSIV